jgi:hypothetical protein
MTKLVHYCCGSYDSGNVGGVARFDYQIKLAFPDREWFEGPGHKDQMLKRCQELVSRGTPFVVMVDNHLACDIPNLYKCVIVHHGVAKITYERTPSLKGNSYFEYLVREQSRMFKHRNPENTIIISCSQNCIDDFATLNGEEYLKFKNRHLLWHPSELIVKSPKTEFNRKPIVLGNFDNGKKGGRYIPALKKALENEFEIRYLQVPYNKNIDQHNLNKTNEYLKADIFLQLSTAEGNSYATLDAFACGLLVIGTNVGLLYDLEKSQSTAAMVFDWKKMGETQFMADQIRKIWEERESRTGLSRTWFEENATLEKWKQTIQYIVE